MLELTGIESLSKNITVIIPPLVPSLTRLKWVTAFVYLHSLYSSKFLYWTGACSLFTCEVWRLITGKERTLETKSFFKQGEYIQNTEMKLVFLCIVDFSKFRNHPLYMPSSLTLSLWMFRISGLRTECTCITYYFFFITTVHCVTAGEQLDFADGEDKSSRTIKGAPLESLFAQFCLHSLWFGDCNIRGKSTSV